MHIPKLSEFSVEELSELIAAVNDKLKDCSNALKTLSGFDDSGWKSEGVTSWRNRADILLLWKTQLMNALVEVKKKQTANLN